MEVIYGKIKDIAEKSGVSVSAVSRILNNDPTLSASLETKRKVMKVAKKLGIKKYPKPAKPCLSWEFCNGFHQNRKWRTVIT